jgi:hypothetical protein
LACTKPDQSDPERCSGRDRLRASEWGKAKGRSPVAWELCPMIEAGGAEHEEVALRQPKGMCPPTGDGMVAPRASPRKAPGTSSEGRDGRMIERGHRAV